MIERLTRRRRAVEQTIAAASLALAISISFLLSPVALAAGERQQKEEALPGTCDSVSTLFDRVQDVKDLNERERLLSSLRTTPSRDCVGVFLGALQTDRPRDIQEVATEVLVALGDDTVIRGIEDVLRQNPDVAVRARLGTIIENISTPTAAPFLGQALANRQDETLLIAVPVALGRIGTDESLRQLVNISALLGEKDWPYILRGFARIRSEEGLVFLLKTFQSGVSGLVREGVALALGNYDKPEVAVTIESFLRTEPPGRVREALQFSWSRISQRATQEGKQ